VVDVSIDFTVYYGRKCGSGLLWHFNSIRGDVVQTVLKLTTDSRHKAELVQALRGLARSARSERGFISSRVCQEEANSNEFFYEEEWTSREELERQIRSPRYSRLLALMETSKTQPRLEFRLVAEVRGLEYVETLRLGHGQVTQDQGTVGLISEPMKQGGEGAGI
jgi:quinol monooxygenase YgiN